MNKKKKMIVRIKKIGINGEGIAYYKRKITFVRQALPGELVLCEVVKETPGYILAFPLEIKKKSPHRLEGIGREFLESGAYSLAHVDYSQQLLYKKDIVLDALGKYSKIPHIKQLVKETLASPNIYHYRNKNQFPVIERKGKVMAGLYREGSHHLVEIKECMVLHEHGNQVTEEARKALEKYRVPIANKRKKGIQYISTRTSFATGLLQLIFVANTSDLPDLDLVVQQLSRNPLIESIMLNLSDPKSHLVMGSENRRLYGGESIIEKIGSVSYRLSANSFFQLNPAQTKNLYDKVLEFADLKKTDRVLDAFCGVGSIGLYVSPYCKEVRGIDIVKQSIENAKENIQLNNFSNCHYEVADATKIIPKWKKEGRDFDVIIVDPPRTGLEEMAKHLLEISARKIVYVSCNPSSLARDLEILKKKYQVKVIQPVDMFPQTAQVEAVCLLVKEPCDAE